MYKRKLFVVSSRQKPAGDKELENKQAQQYYNRAINYESAKDYDKAVEQYKSAIALGNSNAMVGLACLYLTINFDNLSNIDEVINLLEHAMQLENGLAMIARAKLYLNGQDDFGQVCEQNTPQAVWLLARAKKTLSSGEWNKIESKETFDQIIAKGPCHIFNQDAIYQKQNSFKI